MASDPEDQQTILSRRIHNRVDDVFDIQGPILSFLSHVVVEDGLIGNEMRLKYANKVTPEAFDFLEKVLAEEVKRYELCQRISKRFNRKFPTQLPLPVLRALIDEMVENEGEIKVATKQLFELENKPKLELIEHLEMIAQEELEKDRGLEGGGRDEGMNKTDIDIDIIDIELELLLLDSDASRSDLLKGIAIHYFESTVVDAKNIPRLIKEYPDGTKIELPLPERAKKHFEQYLK